MMTMLNTPMRRKAILSDQKFVCSIHLSLTGDAVSSPKAVSRALPLEPLTPVRGRLRGAGRAERLYFSFRMPAFPMISR